MRRLQNNKSNTSCFKNCSENSYKENHNKSRRIPWENQFGFRKGCGTREAIGVMRMLCERSLEHDNELFICFVNFEKAFDRVKWTKLWHILKTIGIDWRDRRLISNLYLQQEAIIMRSGKWLLQTSIYRQRAAAGLPTFAYTLSNLFGNDGDRCYGRNRGGNQGRRKASERCALRR